MVHKEFGGGGGGGAREKGGGLTPVPEDVEGSTHEDVDEGREDGEEGPKVGGGGGGGRSVRKKHDVASKTESSSSSVRGNRCSTYNYLLCSFTFIHSFFSSFIHLFIPHSFILFFIPSFHHSFFPSFITRAHKRAG